MSHKKAPAKAAGIASRLLFKRCDMMKVAHVFKIHFSHVPSYLYLRLSGAIAEGFSSGVLVLQRYVLGHRHRVIASGSIPNAAYLSSFVCVWLFRAAALRD